MGEKMSLLKMEELLKSCYVGGLGVRTISMNFEAFLCNGQYCDTDFSIAESALAIEEKENETVCYLCIASSS